MIVSTDSEVIFEKLVVGGGALRFWRQLCSFFLIETFYNVEIWAVKSGSQAWK